MTKTEALTLLKHHSYTHNDLAHPETQRGFLGMLRPFQGQLYEENFQELMLILKVLSPCFKSEQVDKEIMAAYWGICHLARAWGLEPAGMLRRNNLLTGQQIKDLAAWIDCISDALSNLLDGAEDELAFEAYEFYLKENRQ